MPSLIADLNGDLSRFDACRMPGYRNGPGEPFGTNVGYICERNDGHEGDHAWRYSNPITWPVTPTAIPTITDIDPQRRSRTGLSCQQPGSGSGPFATGGEAESYYCERSPYHTGDHAWGRNGGSNPTTWAIAEPTVGEALRATQWCDAHGVYYWGTCSRCAAFVPATREECATCGSFDHTEDDHEDEDEEPYDEPEERYGEDCDCDNCVAAAEYEPGSDEEDEPESDDPEGDGHSGFYAVSILDR